MKNIKLPFLLFLSLFFLSCGKQNADIEPEPLGFKIKIISINSISSDNNGICWDELNCDNEEGNPDIYLKIEQVEETTLNRLTFFTSKVFNNHKVGNQVLISIPDRVFSFDFLYHFNAYDEDDTDDEDDKIYGATFSPKNYLLDDETIPVLIGDNDGNFVFQYEFVY